MGEKNVTSKEKSKMTEGFQPRSRSRGLNCLRLFSLHLSVYLFPRLNQSLDMTPFRVQVSVACQHQGYVSQSDPPSCRSARARTLRHSVTQGARSAVTQKCSGVY